ncbi:Up-regulated during septation-domain-containing protein [Desarmillaria tabescens]|uniref:Up-regulated during septation-domain-containing protein n=1 Tax=Armillaria tabescens TaxID=1929756 RepID=A0AA39T3H0_ARMTA|nr:Up-regulated during septation-domain-containing protein [Desarmillaria tabescens]KAK0461786.1 Up-regulated during septation-domain-containing protein [Desarmillaria tabescens]
MNGVRRFLGAATTTVQEQPQPQPPPPLDTNGLPPLKSGPTWPPQSPTSTNGISSPFGSPKMTTAGLFLRKDRQKPPPPVADDDTILKSSLRSSNVSTSSLINSNGQLSGSPVGPSPPRGPPSRIVTRKSVKPLSMDSEYKRSSSRLNNRDELLLSLLASDAVVDSRDFEILSFEEVDELKKEHQVLMSRLGATEKKLTLETKIRDAAVSLSKVNQSNKKMSKQTEEQLESANRRVDIAQKELWRVSERVNEITRRLLEHRAGVLSYSVRSMEKKMAPSSVNGHSTPRNHRDSGYETPNRSVSLSPTTTSIADSSFTKFDGAHFFAGHADAIVPTRQRSPDSATREIFSLEEKLKAATDSLKAAGQKQADMAKELSHLKFEKEQVEMMMDIELQNAQDTIAALEQEMPKIESLENEFQDLLEEKRDWEREREEQDLRIAALQDELKALESSNAQAAGNESALAQAREASQQLLEDKDAELRQLQAEWEHDRLAWDQERARLEDEKLEDLTRLQDEMDRVREEDVSLLQKATDSLEEGQALIQALVHKHSVPLFSRELSLRALLSSVDLYLERVGSKPDLEMELEETRKKLDDEVSKREALLQDLEEARREREDAKKEARIIAQKMKEQLESNNGPIRSPITPTATFPTELTGDAAKIVAILQPLWTMLPSPEARAAKFNIQRQFRTGSPTASAPSSPSSLGHNNSAKSLSDLDVRSLKALYDIRSGANSSPNPGSFTVEAFAARVQALVSDDRSLIERLLRFAQAHDLLKKNADRAQKLAQEGSIALETYQKQVRMLEDRNMSMASRYAGLEDEMHRLQDSVDMITSQKLEIEMQAAEQAETCRQLTEANNTLSARALTLAEEAASAPEAIRKQLEAQLAESRVALKAAQEELDTMISSEQNQKAALLDELNTMQTENGQLRAQLRAVKK